MDEIRRCDCCGRRLEVDVEGNLCDVRHIVRCVFCGVGKPWEEECSCGGLEHLNSLPEKRRALCEHCGEPFYQAKKSEKHCTRRHYKECDVEDCREVFRIYDMNRISKGCSPRCRARLTHTDASRAKRRENNLERYGVEYTFQREDVKEKLAKNENVKSTQIGGKRFLAMMREKHGVDNYGEIYGKTITGDRNPMRRPEVRAKVIATNMERYGRPFPLGSKKVQDKTKKTMMERYGVECSFQIAAVRAIPRPKRPGWRSSLLDPKVQAKIRATNLDRYGAENPFASKEIQGRIKATNMERYGVENPSQSPEIRARAMATYERNANSVRSSKRGSRVSKLNRRFLQWMEDAHGINLYMEKVVGSFAYDFYLKERNLLIDLNPTISHNTLTPYGCVLEGCGKDCSRHRAPTASYHQDRAFVALEAGFGLVSIYGWNKWKDSMATALSMEYSTGDRWINLDCFPSMEEGVDLASARLIPPTLHWSRGKNDVVGEKRPGEGWLPVYDGGAVVLPGELI